MAVVQDPDGNKLIIHKRKPKTRKESANDTTKLHLLRSLSQDKERGRESFYQETLELKPASTQMDGAWVEYDLGPTTIVSVVIRLGNRHATARRSLLRSKILTLRSSKLKDAAVSLRYSKRLKRLCAGWRNFAIQTETSWSFTNASSDDKARMANVDGRQNA
jgi:hypothetical protein